MTPPTPCRTVQTPRQQPLRRRLVAVLAATAMVAQPLGPAVFASGAAQAQAPSPPVYSASPMPVPSQPQQALPDLGGPILQKLIAA